MQQVKIIVGISGSGKSTYSKQFVDNNSSWLRINRDELRKSILNISLKEYWNWNTNDINRIESIVTTMQTSAINVGLKNNWNLIIDNTNLKLSYINSILNILKDYNVEVSFKFIDCSLQQAIINNHYRVDDKVGENIIKQQYEDLKNLKKIFDFSTIYNYTKETQVINKQNDNLPKCILVDIDGTIADKGDRNPFDWNKVHLDIPRKYVINIINVLSESYEVIFMSGRDEVCRESTIEWIKTHLRLNNNDTFKLFMRANKDQRKDSIVKKELYKNYIENNYFVEMIFDDRNQVVDMWRQELGLPVCQVNYGDF